MKKSLLSIALVVIATFFGVVGFGLLGELLNDSRDGAVQFYLFVGVPAAALSLASVVALVGLWRR